MDQPNPAIKLCECGCGQPTKISTETDPWGGAIAGTPRRFLQGHNRRNHLAIGQRFGQGVILEVGISGPRLGGRSVRWARLLCDCGTEYVASITALVAGDYLSCGCLRGRLHGMYRHPLYGTWQAMLDRCENPGNASYANYGGRGISVCERWHDVHLFVADIETLIGPRPEGTHPSGTPLYSLDRWPDNNGNYEPGNVRWATAKQQGGNRRPAPARMTSWNHEQWAIREWRTEVCEYCGDEYKTRSVKRNVRFCSKKCQLVNARAEGRYHDVERVCHVCGAPFTTWRYRSASHCSKSCSAKCRCSGGCPR